MDSPDQQQVRILLAEDDAAMRKAVKLNFVREGWFVIEAENGEEALALARQHRLDAAILDVMMPKLMASPCANLFVRKVLGCPFCF